MPNTLTKAEGKRLKELEETIEQGRRTFVAVGNALIEIRDAQLYRLTDETFETYCQGRWGFSAQRARQLMGAAEVIDSLPGGIDTIVAIPTTESQARELGKVEPERRGDVWIETVERAAAGKKKITAALVREVAEETEPTKPAKKQKVDNRPGIEARAKFDEIEAMIVAVQVFGKDMADAGYFAIVGKRLDQALGGVLGMVRDTRPYATCPHCGGTDRDRIENCEQCDRRGWICKMEHANLANRHKADSERLR